MNKKMWLYLILLIAVFILVFLRPFEYMQFGKSISNESLFLFGIKTDYFNDLFKFKSFSIYDLIDLIFPNTYFSKSLIRLVFSVLGFLNGMLFLKIFKGFFKQGCVLLVKKKKMVAERGILVYGIFISLIILFLISVIGIIFSALFLFVFFIIIFLGKISLSVVIGFYFTKRNSIYINFIFGFLIVEIFGFLPGIGWLFSDVLTPIAAAGIITQNIINMKIKKEFYYLSDDDKKVDFDKNKICGIILSDDERNDKN